MSIAVIEIGPRHFTQAAPSVCKPVGCPVKWIRQPDAEFLWFLPHRGNSPGCFSFAAAGCPRAEPPFREALFFWSHTDSSRPRTDKDTNPRNRLNPFDSQGDDCRRPRRIGTSEVIGPADLPLSSGCGGLCLTRAGIRGLIWSWVRLRNTHGDQELRLRRLVKIVVLWPDSVSIARGLFPLVGRFWTACRNSPPFVERVVSPNRGDCR
jgi:hypothetical protein